MNCSICSDPKRAEFVAVQHLDGRSPNAIESLSRAADSPVKPIKSETIRRHLNTCLFEQRWPENPPTRLSAAIAQQARGKSQEDVATLVQEEVVRKLQAGEARVTVQHGLQAQQLLDRREERKQDRALAITLTRMLHTMAPPQELIGEREVVIEGTAVEVS